MSDAVLVALITGAAAVLSNWLITRSNREKDTATRAKNEQEVQDRLKSIEQKVDEHNGYALSFFYALFHTFFQMTYDFRLYSVLLSGFDPHMLPPMESPEKSGFSFCFGPKSCDFRGCRVHLILHL